MACESLEKGSRGKFKELDVQPSHHKSAVIGRQRKAVYRIGTGLEDGDKLLLGDRELCNLPLLSSCKY